jgi:hypothetical protein
MTTFLYTILFAIILIILGLLALGIGWLITGRQKLKRGTCGYDPNQLKKQKEQEQCGKDPSCPVCSPKIKKINPTSKEDL